MHEGLSITIKSVTVLVGFTMFILGAVEIGVAITGEGGSFLKGVPVLVLGAIVGGIPLWLAFRDMVADARKDEALAAKLAREQKPEE